jgi:hypothetical protein
MQKNCTEFIAYENVARDGGGATQRHAGGFRQDRGRGAASLDQALPLVKRALKVLTDREVSPQLGLLKSTLLQLDSSFSERDYGASTFRDFAEKLEQRGLVTLKHSGRTTLVELAEGAAAAEEPAMIDAGGNGQGAVAADAPPTAAPAPLAAAPPPSGAAVPPLSLADSVALVRQVLAEATTPPRWPMYLRQMKQFIRTARPDFDERRYGSLPDLLRACQKDGLLRLERDRQGGLRAFAGSYRTSSVPHGWGTLAPQPDVELDEAQALADAPAAAAPAEAEPEPFVGAEEPQPIAAMPADEPIADLAVEREDGEPADDQLAMFGVVAPHDPEPVAKRARKTRKTAEGSGRAGAERPKRAPRRPAATRTRSRRNPS